MVLTCKSRQKCRDSRVNAGGCDALCGFLVIFAGLFALLLLPHLCGWLVIDGISGCYIGCVPSPPGQRPHPPAPTFYLFLFLFLSIPCFRVNLHPRSQKHSAASVALVRCGSPLADGNGAALTHYGASPRFFGAKARSHGAKAHSLRHRPK